MASSMLIFSATTADLPELVSSIKSRMKDKMVDPYLHLVEDVRLQATYVSSNEKTDYGSVEDEAAALKFLEALENNDGQLKETTISHLTQKFDKLTEDEIIGIKEQILQGFSPEDVFPVGAPLFIDTPQSFSPLAQKECESFDEVMAPSVDDEDPFPDVWGNQSDRKMSESSNSIDVLCVNELIESVLETARQVATLPVSTAPVPYDQMKSQCEALVIGKQQKMSVLLSFEHQQDSSDVAALLEDNENNSSAPAKLTKKLLEEEQKSIGKELVRHTDSMSSDSEKSFRLPPASPYDKFLKAAGCSS